MHDERLCGSALTFGQPSDTCFLTGPFGMTIAEQSARDKLLRRKVFKSESANIESYLFGNVLLERSQDEKI